MASNILAVCPVCQEQCYRSVKPIESKDDCIPENFAPVGEAPPPTADGPPLCYKCSSVLTFVPEISAQVVAEASRDVRRQAARQTAQLSGVETLFELRSGESFKEVIKDNGALIVLTDRRVVRIATGA